jgi:hypothetical protein
MGKGGGYNSLREAPCRRPPNGGKGFNALSSTDKPDPLLPSRHLHLHASAGEHARRAPHWGEVPRLWRDGRGQSQLLPARGLWFPPSGTSRYALRATQPPLSQRVDLRLPRHRTRRVSVPDRGQAIQIGDNAPLFPHYSLLDLSCTT